MSSNSQNHAIKKIEIGNGAAEDPVADRLVAERQRLLQMATKVKSRYLEEQKSAMEDVSDSSEGGDGAAISQAGDVDVSIGYLLDERFDRISEALNKLKEGTYGMCEQCGSKIPVERLEILPEATLCVRCQELEERSRLPRERSYDAQEID